MDRVVNLFEKYLSYRKKDKYIKKEIQKSKGIVRDWVGAIIWAVCVVFLINQYIFQLYGIPTGSMISTLLVNDKIFVNKMVYGPEVLPGGKKLNGAIKPSRGDIIVFPNPDYQDRGVIFNTAQRLIYMLTLTKVDLDKNEKHYFIKRAIGCGGDTFKFVNGQLYIKPMGLSEFYPEPELISDSYFYNSELPLSIKYDAEQIKMKREAMYRTPHLSEAKGNWALVAAGKYIPAKHYLALGDNRDNSSDGRYFGLIREDEIIGKASFRIFPLSRAGGIE
ncbi:MAG: signal peptidase I [Spirochaetales bacterium]|nr:signal peptidase I [Spirochaetales bacterium]